MKNSNAKTIVAALVLFVLSATTVFALGIDSTDKYAWGENVGWLNWGTPEGDVDVPASTGDLTGYVWGENIGWISLNCSNTASCGTVAYSVSRAAGELSGYGWGENVGWISFSCVNTGSCGVVDYRVLVDNTTGIFSGYAWGENIGWISTNCSNTGSCGVVDYKVKTTAPGGGGGGGGGFIPTPTATPTASPAPSTGAIWINDYATTTKSRIVRLGLFQPFGGNGSDVTVVLLNEKEASAQDRAIIAGGTRSGTQAQEFSGGVRRPFSPVVPTWDLCPKGQPCPDGPYRVYAQFTKPTTAGVLLTQTVLAAMGDQVSGPYNDSISLTTTTPTPPPSLSATPFPTGTPLPSPTGTPTAPPPTKTPPVGPPIITPPPSPSPVVLAVDRFSRWLDGLFERLFGLLGPTAQELCGTNAIQTIACGSTAVGLAAAIAAIVAALIQKELLAAAFSMFQVFGLKRKARVWGVIYDTSTKRPVPLAKVELHDEAGRLLETRFADADGRYGFLTSPASVRQGELNVSITAAKPGYAFPSTRIAGDVDYVVYDRLYKGGMLTLREGALVNYNIPLDPISARRASLSGFGRSLIGTVGDRLLAFAFYIGLVVVPLNYFLLPTTANLVILVAFLLVNVLRLFVVYRPYGMTLDAATGKPMPYALVTLNDATGARVSFAVSDEHGRFILSGKPGATYELIGYTPANTQSQRTAQVRTRGLRGRGWVTERLRI